MYFLTLLIHLSLRLNLVTLLEPFILQVSPLNRRLRYHSIQVHFRRFIIVWLAKGRTAFLIKLRQVLLITHTCPKIFVFGNLLRNPLWFHYSILTHNHLFPYIFRLRRLTNKFVFTIICVLRRKIISSLEIGSCLTLSLIL